MIDSWDGFHAWLKAVMATWKVTNRELADRISLDRPPDQSLSEDKVANWRRGRSRPDLAELPQIVNALNALRRQEQPQEAKILTVHELLREMRVLGSEPDDLEVFDTALRLQKLQLKLRDANYYAATQGGLFGASRINQAAIDGGKWAVAVWPAYEGPSPTTRIHVSDRIDFRRLSDGSTPTNEEVWSDEMMKAALRAAHAVPSRARPRWIASSEDPRPTTGWSILHLGIPRDPVVPAAWAGLPGGFCFISTTLDSWVTDAAALTSMMIGYGLTTTEDLAMEIFGSASVPAGQRWRYHEQLLRDPPRRDVWCHHGAMPGDRVNPFDVKRFEHDSRSETVFVLLDETDELVEEAWETDWPKGEVGPTKESLYRTRDLYREYADRAGDRVIVVQADLQPDRKRMWTQVFNQTHLVLTQLQSRHGLPQMHSSSEHVQAAERRYPSTLRPFLNWLAETDSRSLS